MDYEKVRDRALDLLKTGWTQGAFARDAGGKSLGDEYADMLSIPSEEEGATCWCLMGSVCVALEEICGDDHHTFRHQFHLFELRWELDNKRFIDEDTDMTSFNDGEETQEDEVLSSLRRMDFSGEVVA